MHVTVLADVSVAGPHSTKQLHFVSQRLSASMVQSSASADSNRDTHLGDQTESDAGPSLQVHTADSQVTSVDVFHAYCALAVVRHRHSDCSDELTACEAAGLCRLLLWDVDMCQRRCDEELMYIDQLQTGLSAGSYNCDPLSTNTHQLACQQSGHPDDSSTSDDSQATEHEPTLTNNCVKSDLVSQQDRTAVESVEVNTVSNEEKSGPDSQECSEWQNLPVDVKYTERELSKELLQQEANRLRRLRDSISHCVVITVPVYCFY